MLPDLLAETKAAKRTVRIVRTKVTNVKCDNMGNTNKAIINIPHCTRK